MAPQHDHRGHRPVRGQEEKRLPARGCRRLLSPRHLKNIAETQEATAISEALTERLVTIDAMLQHLGIQQDKIIEQALDDPEELLKSYLFRAMDTKRAIDRTFWIRAAADVIRQEPPETHPRLLRLGARAILWPFDVPYSQRLAATRFLFAKVIPVN